MPESYKLGQEVSWWSKNYGILIFVAIIVLLLFGDKYIDFLGYLGYSNYKAYKAGKLGKRSSKKKVKKSKK